MSIQQLTDQYLDQVFRFLCVLIQDRDTAADLTQDTFLKLQNLPRGQALPSEAYVLATARNTALSWLRRRKLERQHVDVLPPDDRNLQGQNSRVEAPDRVIESRELGAALDAALEALPEDFRVVFHLSEVEGLSYAHIAEVVDCPTGTVASRKNLAVQRLRAHLKESGHAL
jgi:RNA polymerase sigma-70 factor (ECF subfamily)